MKVLYLLNAFPDDCAPYRGYFNYKSIKYLSQYLEPVIVRIRTWRPGFKILSSYHYDDFEIYTLALPLIPLKISHKEAFELLLNRFTIFRYIKNLIEGSDLIHSVGLSFNGVLAGYWSRKLGIRHIAQAIGTDVNVELPKLISLPWIKGFIKGLNGIICNSDALKKRVKALIPNVEPVVTIYRGVEIDKYEAIAENGLPNTDELVFLFLGGVANRYNTGFGKDYKGGITLMKAWKILDNEGLVSKRNLRLLFGGYGSTDKFVMEWRDSLNNKDNVELIGLVSPDRVLNLLKFSHIMIVPSAMEGFPNVIMEAAASGRVILASGVGGIPEFIKDEYNGFLFNNGDERDLASVMNKASQNRDILEKIAKLAYLSSKSYFDIKKSTTTIISFYKDVIH